MKEQEPPKETGLTYKGHCDTHNFHITRTHMMDVINALDVHAIDYDFACQNLRTEVYKDGVKLG